MKEGRVDFGAIGHKMDTLRALGVPYGDDEIAAAATTAASQAQLIVDDLAQGQVELAPDSELTALIAYLQRIGRGPQPTGPPTAVTEVEPAPTAAAGGAG